MKRLILILSIIAICGSAVAMPPPTGGFDFIDEEGGVAFVCALGYTEAIQTHVGLAVPLTESVYGFIDWMAGSYGSAVAGKFGYLLSVDGGTYLGLLAGPEAQWHNMPGDGTDPIAYITGATGFIFGHSWQKIGIFGTVQRIWPLKTDIQLEPINSYMIGLHYNL